MSWCRSGPEVKKVLEGQRVHRKKAPKFKLTLFDIERAHFYGKAEREVFVDLEEEDRKAHGADKCGRLLKSMYGTQDASSIWQRDYTALLQEHTYEKGRSNSAVFFSNESQGRVIVHGDDFLILGTQETIDAFEKMLATKYEYKKLFNIGTDQGDCNSGIFLNRVLELRREPKGTWNLTLEPDARHAQIIIEQLGLHNDRTGVEMPNEKRSSEQQHRDAQSKALNSRDTALYKSAVMRAAYLAQDRIDINESMKSLARCMAEPNEAVVQRLRRLGRYLVKYPNVVRDFPEQSLPNELVIMVDTDFAGCALTRKSTTGLIAKFGKATIKHSSNLQSTVSLSSGEAEYYGLVKGGSVGLGLRSLLEDWGLEAKIEIRSDSSAARGHVKRRGLGAMRHIQTRYLCLQERLAEGHLSVGAIAGKVNPADILTRAVCGVAIRKTCSKLGFRTAEESKLQKAAAQDPKAEATLYYLNSSTEGRSTGRWQKPSGRRTRGLEEEDPAAVAAGGSRSAERTGSA